jgi:hypothetical protein
MADGTNETRDLTSDERQDLMDAARTITFFNEWFAEIKARCGVESVDVLHELTSTLDGAGEVRITLSCPVCDATISGTLRETDWWLVVDLLRGKKPN